MKSRMELCVVLLVGCALLLLTTANAEIPAQPATAQGVTLGNAVELWLGDGVFQPAPAETDEVDTLWWTGDIDLHIFGGQTVSWTPDLPQTTGVLMRIKYGLWNSPEVAMVVSVNGNTLGTIYANFGYISPGPRYATANISNYLVAGPDLIQIAAQPGGGEAVIGYVGAGVRSHVGDGGGMESLLSLPADFNLQITPNPFNPTTAISYKLQTASRISLRVYDTAGRLVATLVDGWREPGAYEVAFDGSKLASGIYLYHLTAGSYVASGKMVLLK